MNNSNYNDKNSFKTSTNNNKVLTLNVGGVTHTATQSTLCRYPNSMIARMFNGSLPPTQTFDGNGNIFIDRDGILFGHILNFLRSGHLSLPDNFHSFDSLQIEADYFGIEELLDSLKKIDSRQNSIENHQFSGFLIEIMEFEEASSFNRFYSINEQHGNNTHWKFALKNGGLIVSGHKDVLTTLPIGYVNDVASPHDYHSVVVYSRNKMEVFHHLSSHSWRLCHAGLSYSADSDGSYIIHEYIWQMPPLTSSL